MVTLWRSFGIGGPGRSLICGGLCVLLVVGVGAGCRNPEPNQVVSYLEGEITGPVTAGVGGQGRFRVLVMNAHGRRVDTLGQAVTDPEGRFSMTVRAAEPGIYPLSVWGPRGQKQLLSTDYVVANRDSGTLDLDFPLREQSVRVRSRENEALAAYRNTIAQHRRVLQERLRADSAVTNAMSRGVRQTSSMLWSLQKTFSDTYASEFGAMESLSLLAGWDDSLVVERARTIEASSPHYIDAARFAYYAVARQEGREAAFDMLETFASQAITARQRAGLEAIRVRAFVDSQQTEAARSAAQTLRNEYPRTKWARWARRIGKEVWYLRAGARVPNLRVRTVDGDSLSLRDLQGRPVVLEYFRPGNETYHRQLRTRNALYRSTRADSVAFVSVSVEPDTLVYKAFARARVFPGHQVLAPRGMDDPMVTAYNVFEVPTRILIDRDRRFVGRYLGVEFFSLQEDLAEMLREER